MYEESPEIEMPNMFKSPIEYLSRNDIAWTIYQYINSYDDWCAKRDDIADRGSRHKLHTKIIGASKHRLQPSLESEGMFLLKRSKDE